MSLHVAIDPQVLACVVACFDQDGADVAGFEVAFNTGLGEAKVALALKVLERFGMVTRRRAEDAVPRYTPTAEGRAAVADSAVVLYRVGSMRRGAS